MLGIVSVRVKMCFLNACTGDLEEIVQDRIISGFWYTVSPVLTQSTDPMSHDPPRTSSTIEDFFTIVGAHIVAASMDVLGIGSLHEPLTSMFSQTLIRCPRSRGRDY